MACTQQRVPHHRTQIKTIFSCILLFTKKATTATPEILEILSSVQKQMHTQNELPFVTLSYAQSLNGIIAVRENGGSSSNLPISSEDTWVMSHALRSIHDGILVGGSTLCIDNPRLNVRLWDVDERQRQPKAIVLDTQLRHLKSLLKEKKVRAERLIVCCSHEVSSVDIKELSTLLSPSDVTFIQCKKHGDELDLQDVLHKLYNNGIHSIMVEGGSSILSAFAKEKNLVNCIIVTIAPRIIGGLEGLNAFGGMGNHVKLNCARYWNVGEDCVMMAQWPKTQ